MPAYRYARVDVFTETPLTGNPLIVFTNGSGLDTKTMQAIAREMNLSEAVFVLPAESGGTAKIRIFTPKLELPFAGHPVLGAAFVLAAPLQSDQITLETGQGNVPVTLEREGPRPVMGWMQAPLPTWQDYSESETLLLGLGVAQSRLPISIYDIGVRHAFVALDTPEQVHALKPDFTRLAPLGHVGVGAFAWDADKVTLRVFFPGVGVNEDPATGSAAACLAVHLVRNGCYASDTLVTIHQGERMGRPSILYARAVMNGKKLASVTVGGCAVTVGRGELQVTPDSV
jgi:trans-2,3-dihydro-3-hydroxyanthranilate isomerase